MMISKKYLIYIFIAAISLFAAFFVGRNSLKEELYYSNQNLIAANDTIKKLNDINAYIKSTYILKEKELNDLLNISNDEISKLKKDLNDKISYISKIESNIKIDTMYITDTSISKDSTHTNIDFKYNERWVEFNGNLSFNNLNNNLDNFKINYLNIPAPLTIGLTSDNKMFVKSDNPYLNISRLDGAYIIENLIDKNKQNPKWSHGIGFGFGFQYGIVHKQIDFGPQIGYVINYNF